MCISNITHAIQSHWAIHSTSFRSKLTESFSLWSGMMACQCCPTATSWGGYPAEGVGGISKFIIVWVLRNSGSLRDCNVTFLTWTMLQRPCLALFSYCGSLLLSWLLVVYESVFHSVIVHSCCVGCCLSVPTTQSEHVGRELPLVGGIKCHCTDLDSAES